MQGRLGRVGELESSARGEAMARNDPGWARGDEQRELRKARMRGGWRSRGRLRRASSEQEESQEKMVSGGQGLGAGKESS